MVGVLTKFSSQGILTSGLFHGIGFFIGDDLGGRGSGIVFDGITPCL